MKERIMCEGIAAELEGIDLGDKRLNKRSQKLIEALAANSETSINSACDGWGWHHCGLSVLR